METKRKLFLLSFIMMILAAAVFAQPSVDGFQVYYGSLHNHSNVSDGQGTPDEAYNYAKNVANLDFFGLSDHSNLMNAAEWLLIKTTANLYNQDSVFAAFYGFEWTTYFSYGHVTVVNTEDYCSNTSPTQNFDGLLNWINARNCAAFFNHLGWEVFAFSEFDHFTDPPSSGFVGMELWNDHDGFGKYYYNDGYYSNDGNKGYFDEALVRQWKIGAAGGDDNHSATWGTATPFRMGVLAPAKTRTEIFNALLARRFFSTLDENLVLSIKINGFDMGSTILGGTWNLEIESFDADNEIIANVVLLKNGVVIQSWTPGLIHPEIIIPMSCADGDCFYARVTEADGDEAISSPVFIQGVAQPPQIAITSPEDGAVFTAGSEVSVLADASDTDGAITNVEFYIDGVLLGQDNLPPYIINWTALLPGSFQLTAKAYDDTGLETISAGVNIIIEPPLPEISVEPSNQDVASGSGSTFFTVISNSDWTVTSSQDFCTVTLSGSGNGIITAEYGENTTPETRIAIITVTVTGLEPIPVTLTQEGMADKVLNLSLLLQGLYNGSGTMHPARDENGNAYWGEGIADKITIELHNGSDYTDVLFVVPDVDLHTDGTATIAVPSGFDGSYYIVINHRNSIETTSAVPVSFAWPLISYDFNLETQAYGNNLVLMTDGWRAINGGDVIRDGLVDTMDMTPVDNNSNNFLGGYLNSDVNGDGVTDTADMTIVDNNSAQFVTAILP